MPTFVQLGEQDNAFDLANLLDRISGKSTLEQQLAAAETRRSGAEEESEPTPLLKLVTEENFLGLIHDGAIANSGAVLEASEADIEAVLMLTFALIPRIEASEVNGVVSALLTTLLAPTTTTTNLAPLTTLRAYTTLFNVLSDLHQAAKPVFSDTTSDSPISVELLATVLQRLLSFTVDRSLGRELLPSLSVIEKLIKEWDNAASITASLLCSLAQSLFDISMQCQAPQSEELLGNYLRTVDKHGSSDSKLVSSAANYAKQAALTTINAPLASTAHSSAITALPLTPERLLTLKPIQSLSVSNDKDAAPLLQLLTLLATANVADMQQFTQSNGAFLTANKLDGAQLLNKARTLKLCMLASNAPELLLTYEQIAQGLSIAATNDSEVDDEVERAVIDAILSERIDAKLDQQRRRLQVSRVDTNIVKVKSTGGSAVTFDVDWSGIEKKLAGWKTNLSAVLQKFEGRHQGELVTEAEDI